MLLAQAFNALLWWYLDGSVERAPANEKTLQFPAGYLIEKSLAVYNIFVFIMIFGFFSVPAQYQRWVLIYRVIGANVMRTIVILAGAVLLAKFHWVMYLFGGFLVITGIKMLVFVEQEPDLGKNPLLRWMRGHPRITEDYHRDAFTVRRDGRLWFTPLFMVLVLIEISDLVFAVDSIPAIFAVTDDPFIVFTSNIFAILGLRAMYFLLADVATRFHPLKYGLATVLVFIGVKMLIIEVYKIPTLMALGVVALVIAASVAASLLIPRKNAG